MLSPGIGQNGMYLVEDVSGDILLVFYGGQSNDDGVVVRDMEYTFYKFSNDGEPEWIEVTDIGQHVLFLGGYDHDHDAVAFSIANLQLCKMFVL
jgi:hypothetical protein